MEQLFFWNQLIVFLFIALPGYYAIVLFLFYRDEIARLLRPAFKRTEGQIGSMPAEVPTEERLPDNSTLYHAALDLMEDLKPVFRAAKEQQLGKEPVLEALQIRIQKYPQLKGTTLQRAITNHIEQEFQARMEWVFSNDDLHQVWK